MAWQKKTDNGDINDVAESLDPQDVRSSKNSINYLVVRQLDRLGFLLCQVKSENTTDNLKRLFYPTLLSLYNIENLLSNDLSKAYMSKVELIKEELQTSKFNENSILLCMAWHRILIQELPGIMLPKKAIYDVRSEERRVGKECRL